MNQAHHISIFINCPPEDIYDFASNPENLPQWASGLASADIKQVGDGWQATAPFGKVIITFAERNNFGVMDHDVELESGVVFHNPMRVVPNGNGGELSFTLFRQPDMTDAQFADDKRTIEADLNTLKLLLEKQTQESR